jgi:hypothetical protein
MDGPLALLGPWMVCFNFFSLQASPSQFLLLICSTSSCRRHVVVVVWVQQTTIVVVTTRFNRKLGQLKRISAMEMDSQR